MPSKELLAFYRSTPMREGVLCWYPFEKGATVLDISGGSLTEWLQKRCGRVTVAGGLDAANTPDAASVTDAMNTQNTAAGFDYIVLLDPEDFSTGTLHTLKGYLNPHGRLLLAYENPFALRYWSGKTDPGTGVPYSSLLPLDDRPSKAELQIRLRRAGFAGQKWYYPLTDHWFTNEVYSDAYLPDEYLKHRFMPYVADDEHLQFNELVLYREVIRGGAFTFMCGAYLVEARSDVTDTPCPVDFAAVTAYRAPARRFATVVYNDGTVRKMPLHEEGRMGVERIRSAHEDLARLGVNVVPVRVENDALVMPRMDLPTLCDYWAEQLAADTLNEGDIIRLFDKIRDAIYRAAADGRCYWEMVPANCFYDAARDTLIFFDQEYYWDHTPPDAAVVRAVQGLSYSPALHADPRSAHWRKILFERYGLSDCWETLTKTAIKDTAIEVFGEGTAVLQAMTARAGERVGPVRFLPVAGILRKKGFIRPIIYGYGQRGRGLVRALCQTGMTPAALVDKRFAPGGEEIIIGSRMNSVRLPAYAAITSAIAQHRDVDVIVISVLDSAAIEAELARDLAVNTVIDATTDAAVSLTESTTESATIPTYTLEALSRGYIE